MKLNKKKTQSKNGQKSYVSISPKKTTQGQQVFEKMLKILLTGEMKIKTSSLPLHTQQNGSYQKRPNSTRK